ncbi:non-ribosomal peptide synthetase [Chitinophaga nivalis]|uniref:Amino acid adenylation domain-containing protein n=1 Tax=Chitinophaga nivalis TaxID=2991709 RepID=A0ABT3IJS9_9BACT|nr:non-ribosomal peptide synthetase [Chitinophaga nivalis]MCW3466089.1 amino acid adenylation domain-containing protein [Chitinophaga nivalis]MCW3484220.1 amino acid adenylation domain-containing protein [Chitinophaga nivalis]
MMPIDNLARILQERSQLKDKGVTFIERSNQEEFLSYHELYKAALHGLSYLQQAGMQPQDELVFQINDNKNFVIVFWACILGGIIPVPLSVGKKDDHRQKLFNIWPLLNRPRLIGNSQEIAQLAGFAAARGLDTLYAAMNACFLEETAALDYPDEGVLYPVVPEDIAFIQFSSGSTGQPKGVVLTHQNLMTNIRAISHAAAYTSDDRMLSWMPLTHDMGLIGFHLNPVYCGIQHYLMPPALFIRRPALWIDKVVEHKASIICSPNFGYNYLLRHWKEEPADWDLQHVRLIYNGAEPVSARQCAVFSTALKKYGLPEGAMRPVYGLAEASLAVSISRLNEPVSAIALDRDHLHVGNGIVEKEAGKGGVLFVQLGGPVLDCGLRIAADDDQELPPATIGHVQIKGDNVTGGYYNNPTATANAITADDWLRTGDIGFLRNGELYIIGRAKDILFVNGQNYYPHDIEAIMETVEGIELNKAAVTGYFNHDTQQEEILAFVLHRGTTAEFMPLAARVLATVNSRLGFALNQVVPVEDIPRTTSGKLQRFRLLEDYRNGVYNQVITEMKGLLAQAAASTQPTDDTGRRLLQLWQTVLQHNHIGIDQPFFEAGGNSLKAAELTMRVLEEFQVELSAEKFYTLPTIRQQAAVIDNSSKLNYILIPPVGKAAYYAASSAQKRLYYFWELNKTATAYNIPVAFLLQGKISIPQLETALRQLVARHETCSTIFEMQDIPVMVVKDDIPVALNCMACSMDELNEKLKSLVQPFDLNKGPLFRTQLISTGSDRHVLFLDFHHIISDGLSVYHFVRELLLLYNEEQLPDLPLQYRDYAAWEQNGPAVRRAAVQETYWLEQLQGELPLLELPADFPRPAIFSTKGERVAGSLDVATTARLKALAAANDCTLHVLLFTIYNILLSKYTGQSAIIAGIPVAGRRYPGLQELQGIFVNNLAILTRVQPTESFIGLLQQSSLQMKESLQHQDYLFETLLQQLELRREVSRNPLFDNMFVYQNMGFPRNPQDEFSITRHHFDTGYTKFDFSMEVFDEEEALVYIIEYATDLFRKDTIARIAGHFENLIQRVLAAPEQHVATLTLLSDYEYEEFIHKFNQTARAYAADSTMQAWFEKQVALSPDSIALVGEQETLTYRQLNDRANHLAGSLRKKGVVPDSIVAVLLRRSPELVISLLAILKAGGAFLPIDTDTPSQQIRYIVTNSRCKALITSDEAHVSLGEEKWQEAPLIIHIGHLQEEAGESPAPVNTARDMAYVIYTSGTTGNPKGVVIEHRSLMNYITWAAENYVRNETAAFPLFTSISFDLTITALFCPLITGNKLVIYDDGRSNSTLIERVILDNQVNIIKLTPSHLRIVRDSKLLLSNAPGNLKRLIIGGEDLDATLARDIYDKFGGQVELFNEYGPTEATVGCMIHGFDPEETATSVPIGVPAANTGIYILDEAMRPVPTGVAGELYIAGDGLAREYLFQPELTAAKFIPDPFRPDARLYKTGDLARRLPGGYIGFIGRRDQQAKINGYRVELGGIEQQLAGYPGVSHALVTLRTGKKQQPFLCAYYLADHPVDVTAWRSHLAERLPYYMIPAHFVLLEMIPLTKNGKINYEALPDPESVRELAAARPPANRIEAVSIAVWEDVLGEQNIQVTDNFFELGGDSIKAIQIASRLYEQGIQLKARSILTYHTIAQISIHATLTEDTARYEQGLVAGEKDLSPIEAWFFAQRFENPHYYNQSVLLQLKREPDKNILKEALQVLIRHHDSLRLNYHPAKQVLYYNNQLLEEPIAIDRFLLTQESDKPEDTSSSLFVSLKSTFDITTSLLLKVAIIQENTYSSLLFITAHHLLMDGISWRVLLEDLYTVYTALEKGERATLSGKTASLADWQRKLPAWTWAENLKEETAYWEAVTSTVFDIPQDEEPAAWLVKDAAKVTISLEEPATTFLVKEAHHVYHTDVNILLNTALALTLREWTGQHTLVTEQENHGRHLEDPDVSRTLGWFTVMYPLRLSLHGYTTGEHIKAVKEQIRAVPHKGMGYGILRSMNHPLDERTEPMTAVRFNYLGIFDSELDNDLFVYSGQAHGSEHDGHNHLTAKIELNAMIIRGILTIDIHYNTKAYHTATIDWFKQTLIQQLQEILHHIRHEDELHFTPSDFDAADLDQADLDALLA